jgi:hypothetical protein
MSTLLASGAAWQGRKHFFIEKKQQKTFASLEPSHRDSHGRPALQ